MRFYKLDSFDRFFFSFYEGCDPQAPCLIPGGKVGTREGELTTIRAGSYPSPTRPDKEI